MPQKISSAQSKVATPDAGSAGTAPGRELLPLEAQLQGAEGPKDVSGVVVGQVENGSAASELGIQPGNVIESVDQKR